jgi:DNA-binding response OmpR family regulator
MSYASSSPTGTTGVKAGRRFLVVDDNHDFVETIRALLELNGHRVEVAFDGVAGLETAIRMEPDVVVLDVGLPKLNGYEVCRRIREQHLTTQPLIIGATGWAQLVDRELGQYAGFDAHLVKPFGYEELSVLVESAQLSRKHFDQGDGSEREA